MHENCNLIFTQFFTDKNFEITLTNPFHFYCVTLLARHMLSSCVCLSVRLSVTSPYCIKTTGLIELVNGMEASFNLPHIA